jgi:FAD/FMN-containing dehydrogenase
MADLSELEPIVGAQHVLRDPEVLESCSTDFTGRFRGSTEAVIRPGSTKEVSDLVAWCSKNRVALTAQGGNTGLVGGSVPMQGELLLNLRRLSFVRDVEEVSGQLTAGAGTTIATVQEAAVKAGWNYGVDLGSRDSATVGGTIATNAGGLRMIRYGNTRAQVLGVEAVLGDGSVVSHLGGLEKDNTGYDLAGLLCGSEGTLGVICAARLRLVPPAPERTTALIGLPDVGTAVKAASTLRLRLRTLEAAELFLSGGLRLVCESFGLQSPFKEEHPVYLLVEVADVSDPSAALFEEMGSIDAQDTVVAIEPARRAALWRYREGHTEAINALGAPHKLDVSLPLGEIGGFVEAVDAVVQGIAPAAAVWIFGHVGDGNVHVNVTGVAPDDESVDDAVFRLVASMNGSISAEHGIGTAKRRWLALNRTSAELDAYRSIKRALDPVGILNPNVLI